MKTYLSLTSILILLVSCSQPSAYFKKNAELEMIVQDIKSEVESLKHDIRCQNMEIRIVEGKLSSAQEILSVFKQEIMDKCQNKLVDLQSNLSALEQSSNTLKKEHQFMQSGLQTLDFKADTLTKSLNIYKQKVKDIEMNMNKHESDSFNKKKHQI